MTRLQHSAWFCSAQSTSCLCHQAQGADSCEWSEEPFAVEQRNDSGGTSQHIPTSNRWPSTHLRGNISVADLRACFSPRLGNSKEPLLNGLIIFKYPPNQLIPPGLPGPPHLNLCLSRSAFSAGNPNCTMVLTQEPGHLLKLGPPAMTWVSLLPGTKLWPEHGGRAQGTSQQG